MAAYCWGSIINGPLGGVEEELLLYPREIDWSESAKVIKVSCGTSHTLFLTNDGKTYSCGNNDWGQLGHDLLPRKRPQLIPTLENQQIIQICAGDEHSLALNEWGKIYSWGADNRGQLGQNSDGMTSSTSTLTYPKIIKHLNLYTIVQVACGYHHNLALSNTGELFVWGANNYGQLGLGTQTVKETVPKLVTSLAGIPIAFIACGAYHSFAISKSGAVFGWGKNCQGQLGLNDEKMRIFPTQLKTLRSLGVRYISCGEEFSAFLTQDGGVFTCGQGKFGQLGHGSESNENLPRKVVELMGSTITQLACGKRHTLVYVPTRGRIYSFGIGSSGQLGAKQTTDSYLPQVVQGPWVHNKIIEHPDFAIKEIYSGGDLCITIVGNLDEDDSKNLLSTDFRVYDPKTQILTLNTELAQSMAEVPVDVNCDLDLITAVECIVKSQASFNASCLLPNNRHMCCTSRNHGVDFDEAKAVFASISRIENSSLKEIIYDGITKGLIPSLHPNPPDVEALRVYILLPLYHEFINTKNYKSLHTPFAFAVTTMNEIPRRILVKFWTEMDYFDQIVNNYRNIVSYILNFKFQIYKIPDTGQEIKVIVEDPDLIASLNFLAFLYKINQTERKFKCPYDLFVLPELSDMALEVQNDYFNWLKSPASFHLCNYPFLFDGKVKASILRTDQLLQMQAAMQEHTATSIFHHFFRISPQIQPAFVVLNVSRENIVYDTIRELYKYDTRELKRPLRVKFQNEEAEDAGGVTKEFFLLLIKEILDPKYGMFREYEESRLLWFSYFDFVEKDNYWLVGVLCGLAIYNNTIINMPFPLCLYKKLLNEECDLSDLKELSPVTGNSMQSILDYEGDDFEETFDLRFEIVLDVLGEKQTFQLKENGDKVIVTQANKKEFVDLYVDFILNKSISSMFEAFYHGFMKVVGGRVLQLFKPHELMDVIVGNENYDWHALETEANYKNGYTSGDQVIRWFWEVFHALDVSDKKKFLLYLTGSDRIPIQGMKQIKIFIQPTADEKCLPVAHTCFNLLDLPRYSTKERLKYKLLQAIQQTQGFSLV